MKKLIQNWINKNYSIHKLRIDRGSMWWSKLNAIFVAALASIFMSDVNFWYKIISALVTPIIIYVIGCIDIKLKLVDKDNKINSEKNPVLMKILKDIDEIKKKLTIH